AAKQRSTSTAAVVAPPSFVQPSKMPPFPHENPTTGDHAPVASAVFPRSAVFAPLLSSSPASTGDIGFLSRSSLPRSAPFVPTEAAKQGSGPAFDTSYPTIVNQAHIRAQPAQRPLSASSLADSAATAVALSAATSPLGDYPNSIAAQADGGVVASFIMQHPTAAPGNLNQFEAQAYHDYDHDYGYDALAEYDTPSSRTFENADGPGEVFLAPAFPDGGDASIAQSVGTVSDSVQALGRRAREFLEQGSSHGNGKPRFELENDLNYFDSDHRHAHGHAVGADLLALHKRSLSTYSLAPKSNELQSNMAWDRGRRSSHDDFPTTGASRKFIINVEETKRRILEQEDTDGDCQITVQDAGPKMFTLGTANSNGFHKFEIRGTYMLSNLLQELALATDHGRKFITIDESRLNENPVDRMHRLIKYHFWDGLTRRIDAEGLEVICADPKNRQQDQQHRIYVPFHDDFALQYYKKVQKERPHLRLDVVQLPDVITPQFVQSLNKQPGLLSLALRRHVDPSTGAEKVVGTPFVVPGGRFNEMYGWDSYFEALGLLIDGRIALAQGMVENFMYEIEHYGKILNANRSYYLTRSQPPFLTDMILQVYRAFVRSNSDVEQHRLMVEPAPRRAWEKGELKVWLARGVRSALKELFGVWMCPPRLDPETGLSKYHPEGIGMPPETESNHFHHVLLPFAKAHNMTIEEFEQAYARKEVNVPELDEYFIHDRAVRESGHDTTYRFDGNCANLATIDLNSLLYKYELDLYKIISEEFGGSFRVRVRRGANDEHLKAFHDWLENILDRGVRGSIGENGGWNSSWGKGIVVFDHDLDEEYHSLADNLENPSFTGVPSYSQPGPSSGLFSVVLPASLFLSMSKRTRQLVHRHLWSEEDHLFYDYDCRLGRQSPYKSCTALWALWSGVATAEQAAKLVPRALQLFEVVGGLVAGTEESRGPISLARPNRQWDYPYGWAPHQVLAWEGLERYGYHLEARRLVYRWLYTLVKAFVDFNGVVPEKFDVVGMTHRVQVEYGNVGTDFRFVVREGFGWMNASFQ
ncbi:alpha,alpha-trehalase nth1, partial [Cladochytrium tenue]